MSSVTPSEDIIRDRAAFWAARLNDNDISDAEREELQDWLLADPRHASEFRAHNIPVTLARDFPPELRARLSGYVPSYRDESGWETWRRRITHISLAAALLFAVLTGGWFITRHAAAPAQVYSTRTGEQRTVTFEDGSVAYLNTRTRIEWVGGKCERLVTLGEGEALFDVPYDPTCPFRVLIDDSEIEVLGTRFNVYRKSDGEVIVTVIEGKVAVKELGKTSDRPGWRREVGPNQSIKYRPHRLMAEVQDTVAANAVQWRQGELVWQDQTLAEVIGELSRYTDSRIIIRDPRITDYRIGGVQVVSVRDVRGALERFKKVAPLSFDEHGDTFTLDYQTK